MLVSHMDHLNMSVINFKESVLWYGRVFGFELVESGFEEGQPWGVLRAGEALLCLYQRPDHSQMEDGKVSANKLLHVWHFGLRVGDLEKWEEILAHENLEPYFWEYPNSKSWYVMDPNGYEIEVSWFRNNATSFAGRPNPLLKDIAAGA